MTYYWNGLREEGGEGEGEGEREGEGNREINS